MTKMVKKLHQNVYESFTAVKHNQSEMFSFKLSFQKLEFHFKKKVGGGGGGGGGIKIVWFGTHCKE